MITAHPAKNQVTETKEVILTQFRGKVRTEKDVKMKDDPIISMKTRPSDRQIVERATQFLTSNTQCASRAATYHKGYSAAWVVMPLGIGSPSKHLSSPQRWELRPSPPSFQGLVEWIPAPAETTAPGSARVSPMTPLRSLLFS